MHTAISGTDIAHSYNKQDKVKLKWLQIFRGGAALLIVVHHISASTDHYFKGKLSIFGSVLRGGWIGVDFFFVLSGFIIMFSHFGDFGKRDRLATYIKKRFVRIYPLYWLVTSITLVVLLLSKSNIDLITIVRSYLLIPSENDFIVGLAWSLAYEVMYYLIFAFYLFVGYRISFVFALVHVLLICLKSSGIYAWSDSVFVNHILSGYNLEFYAGCLCAVIVRKRIKALQPDNSIAPALLATLTCIAWYLVLENPYFQRSSIYCRLLLSTVFFLVLFVYAQTNIVKGTRIECLLLKAGDASYSYYLVHPLILAFIYKLVTKIGLVNSMAGAYILAMIVFLIILVIGWVLHKKIERPLLIFFGKFLISR